MPESHHLNALRSLELQSCWRHFPPQARGCRLLEVGAGTGIQARLLADAGFAVDAVELASSAYAGERVFPITDYDGTTLPFESHRFDVLFTSNVLEHIPDLPAFFAEARRVLKDDAVMVHVLPTTAWRLWSQLAHYAWLVKRVFQVGRRGPDQIALSATGGKRDKAGSIRWLFRSLVALRHGETGNFATEFWHFRRRRWLREFRANGYRVVVDHPTGLFYTGASLLGDRLSMPARKALSRFLGSSCRVYVLRRESA